MAISNAAAKTSADIAAAKTVSAAPAAPKFKLADCEFQLIRHEVTGEIVGRVYHQSMVIPVAGSKRRVLNQSHDGRAVVFKSTLPDYIMMSRSCRKSNIAANRSRTYALLTELKRIAANPAPPLSDAWLPTPEVTVTAEAIAQLTETTEAVAAAPAEPDYESFELPAEVPAVAETVPTAQLKPLEQMSKVELMEFATRQLTLTLPKRYTKTQMLDAIHEAMGIAA